MIENSNTEDNSDITLVKSVGPNNDLALNPVLSGTPSPILPPDEDATSLISGNFNAGSHGDFQLSIGSVIKDTYELVAVLGEGGMGAVFKALNKVWEEVEARDPYVAIKVLKPELSANKQLVRSLYSDFDRTKMLANCPNIIKVHGFDRDGPHVYMTMEYLSGKTLGDYLNRTAMNLDQAWFIIDGIGNALAYAHEHNIVHRDIKPGNVIITDDGTVKVLDFGIASKINETEGDETKFGGHELGALTVAYASPEMQRDYPPDARDDIYAFACVIYEVLTGKQFYKQKTKKAAPIHGLNSRQMEAINKALAFERNQRTNNVHELLDKLRPVKTPWVKYLSIGGSVFIIAGLALWGVNKSMTPSQVEQATVSQAKAPIATPPPSQVSTSAAVSEPVPVVAPAAPSQEPVVINREPGFSSMSSDGLIHLQTSKADFKNGESFHLSFTLTQPMYVRVIDRDTKGEVTMLRPNPRQPDKLLSADKAHLFPPDGFNVPVKGSSGNNTVTLVASAQPFPKEIELLNKDGGVSEQVQSGPYSWTQIRYKLHR
jgi:serine/threonine protein kinase